MAEMWFYRRMLSICRTGRVSNVEALRSMQTDRLLMERIMERIMERRCRFVGHILRANGGIERHIMETEMDGKKAARGRQQMDSSASGRLR